MFRKTMFSIEAAQRKALERELPKICWEPPYNREITKNRLEKLREQLRNLYIIEIDNLIRRFDCDELMNCLIRYFKFESPNGINVKIIHELADKLIKTDKPELSSQFLIHICIELNLPDSKTYWNTVQATTKMIKQNSARAGREIERYSK